MKRIISVFLIITLLLVGCGNSGETSTGNSGSNENGTTNSENDNKGSSDEVVTLTFILPTFGEGDAPDLMNKALEEKFYPDHPNIRVEFETPSYKELNKKIITAHTGGVHYDLIFTGNTSVAEFKAAGIIEDLTPYIDKDGIDIMSHFFPGAAQSTVIDGKVYCVPYTTDTRVLAINNKIMEEEGFDLPETKEDMLKIAEMATKDTNDDGVIDQYGFVTETDRFWAATNDVGQWLLGEGGRWYEEENGKYVSTFDQPATYEWLEWVKEIAKYQPNDFVSYDVAKIRKLFADDRLAMHVFGPWDFKTEGFSPENYTLITNPVGAVKSGAVMGGWHMSMGAESEHKEEAWEVLKFLIDPEISAMTSYSMTPVQEGYNYPPFNDDKYIVFTEQLKTATMANPPTSKSVKVAEVWGEYFVRILLDDISIEDAVKETDEKIQKELDEIN